MRKILLVLVLAAVPPAASGADTSALPFLRLPAGARSVAMGEAFTAAADDATALYWNPALLSAAPGNSAALMHASYLEGTSYDFAAASVKSGPNAFALGIQRFSSGDMTEFDDTGADIGSFSQVDTAFVLAYGRALGEGYSLGGAAKYIHSRIMASADAYAFDFGLATPYYLDKVRFAVTAANIGARIQYERDNEDLPFLVRGGAAARLTPEFLLTAEAGLPKAGNKYLAAGVEYAARMDSLSIAGRLGYNSRTASDVPGLSGLSAGCGFGIASLTLDYALTFFGDLGKAHRFSLLYKF
ncbi:MAG: PorV/PorQ family protein [Elusimicrobiaceae bacterium]